MKALTLWQPWASLVALGVKTVETRGWSTSYRGPLAIHAAKRPVREKAELGTWEVWPPDPPGSVHPTHRDPRPARLYRNDVGILAAGRWAPVPLGAVVATCNLVSVAPIGGPMSFSTGLVEGEAPATAGMDVVIRHPALSDQEGDLLVLDKWRGPNTYITEQLPFGDYSPGRYAWLLEDIVALPEPVPAKGRQGLWEWQQ